MDYYFSISKINEDKKLVFSLLFTFFSVSYLTVEMNVEKYSDIHCIELNQEDEVKVNNLFFYY